MSKGPTVCLGRQVFILWNFIVVTNYYVRHHDNTRFQVSSERPCECGNILINSSGKQLGSRGPCKFLYLGYNDPGNSKLYAS